MIRHTILFKTTASTLDTEQAINYFLELKDKIQGILNMMGGECFFNEEDVKKKANRFFTHSISIDFRDKAAYNQFFGDSLTHPYKSAILQVAENGYDGIIGFEIILRQ